jgi:hypothetical protein
MASVAWPVPQARQVSLAQQGRAEITVNREQQDSKVRVAPVEGLAPLVDKVKAVVKDPPAQTELSACLAPRVKRAPSECSDMRVATAQRATSA